MEMNLEEAYFANGGPENSVELTFQGATQVVGTSSVVLLVLTDGEQRRQITILSDKAAERELLLRKGDVAVRRELLPEVMCAVFPEMCAENFHLYIYGVDDGRYLVLLVDRKTLDMIPIRISDAILLSQVARLSILINRRLFEQQSVPFDATSRRMALPLNTLSMEMLRKTLDKAVAAENYEMASMVKEEMEKRRRQSSNTENSEQ